MIDISMLSSHYIIRELNEADVDNILRFCKENTQFYQYCEAEPTREQILNDLHITPPGVDKSSKYYVGFYQNEDLVAIMDLIDGYPNQETGYIGFFMMNKAFQGKQIGTSIICEVATYLKALGKKSIQLGIDKDNPQSTHFWKKNDFVVIREVERNGWTILVAEKTL